MVIAHALRMEEYICTKHIHSGFDKDMLTTRCPRGSCKKTQGGFHYGNLSEKVAVEIFGDIWKRMIKEGDFGKQLKEKGITILFVMNDPDVVMF